MAFGLTTDLGLMRVAVAVPRLRVGDVDFNVARMVEMAREASSQGVQALAFPELSITGYTLGDLVQQQALLAKAEAGLRSLLAGTRTLGTIVFAGMPIAFEGKLFNCSVCLNRGKLLGVVPKTLLPNYREFYESRWFSPAPAASPGARIDIAGCTAPFGADILFSARGILLGVEVCEDLWLPLAPHERQALAGATVLFNISASNEIIGKAEWRRTMVSSESGRCSAAYCYTSCGPDESSNDVVFGGHALIAENGVVLAESERLCRDPQLVVSDIDLDRLGHDRKVATNFADLTAPRAAFRVVEADIADPAPGKLRRTIDAHPFVPGDVSRRSERCKDIFSMQVAALAKKLEGAGTGHIIIGVSGGLDSTLAILVAAKTMDHLSLPRKNIHAYTMPGFGTTPRTKSNATRLCQALGASLEEVDITRSCEVQLEDLQHRGSEDIVFENVQARARTGFLFNKANEVRGIVLGTSDLTEIALGWSTFSGDHLSHYHVNCSVPKTLVRFLVQWVADVEFAGAPARKVLLDVIATPISPELKRPIKGKIAQMSEASIGPVELADFYLYPFIRFGMRPGKILYLAEEARKQALFEGQYTFDDLCRWLESFIRRFFANQFKRTCLPEGPKVGSVSLSPRGDWRMPSDAEPALWLEDLERMRARLALKGPEGRKKRGA